MQVQLIEHNGKMMISADDQLYDPFAFRSFRPNEENIAAFYAAGVRVMSLLISGLNCSLDVPYSTFGETWMGEGEYDFTALDQQIQLFQTHAPDAKLFLMIHLDTRGWWLKQHEGAPDSISNLSQIAGDKQWRDATSLYLEALIAYAELNYPNLVLSYFLMGGRTTEWFSYADYGESHPLKEKAYQEYMGDANRLIPNAEERTRTDLGVFRDPVKQAEAIEYWRFHHELIADTVLYFAKKAKEAANYKKLVGCFFGYLFELASDRLLHEGHLAYEKLFDSEYIDLYSAPSSYAHRGYTGVSAYMNTIDSMIKRKKAYFLEFDHITHQSPKHIEGKYIPGYDSKFQSEAETISVMRRDFCMTTVRRTGFWWFDMFGGWFDSPKMQQQITNMVTISKDLNEISMSSVSEIAVFADPNAMYYAAADSELNTNLLRSQMDGLGRIGAPYDVFSLSELADEQFNAGTYKLMIFLNAFHLSDVLKEKIEQIIEQGISLLWVYTPGLIQDDGFSVQGVSELTGFNVELSESAEQTIVVQPSEFVASELDFGFSKLVYPILNISDLEANVWGTYAGNHQAAIASKIIAGAPHFFSGLGPIPAELLRVMAQKAKVHLYVDSYDPIFANNRLIGVQAQQGGTYRFTLPNKDFTKAIECFDSSEHVIEQGELVVDLEAGETKLYLLTDK